MLFFYSDWKTSVYIMLIVTDSQQLTFIYAHWQQQITNLIQISLFPVQTLISLLIVFKSIDYIRMQK